MPIHYGYIRELETSSAVVEIILLPNHSVTSSKHEWDQWHARMMDAVHSSLGCRYHVSSSECHKISQILRFFPCSPGTYDEIQNLNIKQTKNNSSHGQNVGLTGKLVLLENDTKCLK